MSIEGSINVSALFHDRDGTTAMKVVSLRSSNEYTSGQVAIITGTVGTAAITFSPSDSGAPISNYRDASGALVSISVISSILLKTNIGFAITITGPTFSASVSPNRAALIPCSVDAGDSVSINAFPGTASYTIVIYGEE